MLSRPAAAGGSPAFPANVAAGAVHSPQADIRRLIASATAWLLNFSRTALCPYSALRFASSGHSIIVASKAAR